MSPTSAQAPPNPSLLEEYSPLQDYQLQSLTTLHSPSQSQDDYLVTLPQDCHRPMPSPSTVPSLAQSLPPDCDSQKPFLGHLDQIPSPPTPSAAAQLPMTDQDTLKPPQDQMLSSPTPSAAAQLPMADQDTLKPSQDQTPSPPTPSAAAQLPMADQDTLKPSQDQTPSPPTPSAAAQLPMAVQQIPKIRYNTRSRGKVPPFAKRLCKGTDVF